MTTPHVCPNCQSLEIGRASDQETNRFGGFQLMPLRKCRRCGHLWEPPAPTWVIGVGLAAGAVATGLGVLLIVHQIFVGALLVAAGIGVVVICTGRLRRRQE